MALSGSPAPWPRRPSAWGSPQNSPALSPARSRPSPLNAYLASSRRLGHLLYCYAPPTVLASWVGGLGLGVGGESDLDFEIQTMALGLAIVTVQ